MFLLLIIGIAVLGIFCIVLLYLLSQKKEKDKETEYYNELIQQDLLKLQKQEQELEEKTSNLFETNAQLYEEKHIIETSIESTKAQREEMMHSFELLKEQNEANAKQYKEDQIKIAQEQANQEILKIQNELDKTLEQMAEECDKNIQEYNTTYLDILKSCGEQISNYLDEIKEKNDELNKIQNNISAALEIEKTRQADELAEQKFKILLSNEDLTEINKLKEVTPFLRNARPVYKIIWEGYFRNPTNDLISRVLDNKNVTGVYLITNTTNNMAYVGQAVNVSERWKQHIKCGLGIDTPNNILYQAMKKDGVEKFKFQLIESCPREDLNEKEKYWISFYKTDDFGYNMTRGGS